MSIYDVTFYGVCSIEKQEDRIRLFENVEEIQQESVNDLPFEVCVLQGFAQKTDVLQMEFRNGECEYY